MRDSSQTTQVSFRAYLLMMTIALSAGPLLFLSFYHFQSTYSAVKTQAFRRDHQLTRAFSRELSALIESRVEVVKSLAASATHILRRFDREDLISDPLVSWNDQERALLDTLQGVVDEVRHRSPYFDFMYVARRAGESLAISPLYSPNGESYLGVNYFDRDYFQSLIKSEKVAISQVQLGKRSKRPNIQIVAPIFSSEGSLIGLSEGSVDLKILNEASNELIKLNSSLSERRGRLLVVDHYQQILVDSFGERELLSRFHLLNRLPHHERSDHSDEDSSFDGEAHEVFFDQSLWLMSAGRIRTEGDLEWRVILLRDESDLKANARLSAFTALVPSVLLTLFIALLGLRLTRRLSRDVVALGGALDEIERDGDFESILTGYPSLEVKEWVDLFDHAHRFGATLNENREAIKGSLDAERRHNERQRSLLMALEFIQEGIEIISAQGKILYHNSQAERLSILDRQVSDVSAYWHQRSELEPVELAEEKRESLHHGQTWSESLRGVKGGEERLCEVTLSPQLEEGHLARVIVIIRDVTVESKRREALQISERLASIGSLASGIAHEVNNPLMYILANLDFALEDLGQEELSETKRHELISSIEQAKVGAEQVRDVSRSLLSIARHEGESGWYDLADSIERCLRLVKTEVQHQSRIEVRLEARGYFFGSPSELSQVLMNLIHNALQAMHETRQSRSPMLIIRATERAQDLDERGRDTRAMIEVVDNGPGIPSELVAKVFDPFFTTKERGVGTGLGLSICQRVIHEMDGELTLQSELGEGTCFEISLPIVKQKPSQGEYERQQATKPIDLSLNDKPRVLIVDDVTAITEMLCRQLKSKFIVEGVNSGEEALQRLVEREFDLILSDVMMPNMSGVELYHEVVNRQPELAPRFLFMTGGVLDEADQRFFDKAEVSCLAKPVARKVLISEMKALLKELAKG